MPKKGRTRIPRPSVRLPRMRFPGGKFLAVTLTVLLNAVPAVVMYYGAKAAAAVGNRLSRLRLGLRGLTGGGVGESIPSSLSGGRKTVKAKDKNRKEAKENNSKEAKDTKSLSPEERVESRYRDRIDTWVLSGRVKEDPGDWKALVRQLSADIDAQDAKIKDWSSRVYKDANISVNNHQKKKESVKSVNERRRQERIKGFERQKSGDMKILRDLAKAGGLTVAELRSLAGDAQKAEMSENGESVSPEDAATAEETKEYEKENDNISVNGSEEEDEQQEQQEYSDPDDDILGEEYRPDDDQEDGLDGDEQIVSDEETAEKEEPSEDDVLADSETEDVTPETPEETVTGEEDAPKGSQDEDEEEEESLDETPAGDVAEYNYIWGVAGKGFCIERNVNDFGKDGSAIKSDAKGNFIPNNFSLFRSTNDIESFFDIQTGGNLLKDATGFEILRKGKMTMVGEDNHKKIGRVEERCVIRLLGPRQKEDDTLKMPVKDEKKNDADDSLSEKPETFSESLENALKEWYHIKEQYDNDGVQGSCNVDELEKARKERQTFIVNTEHSISLLADGDDKRQLENSLSSLKIMDGILTESEDIAEWANMQHYTKDSKYFIYNGVVSPSGVVDRTMSRAIYKVANGLMNDTEFKAVCDKEGKGEWYENYKNDPDATIRKWENNGILVGNIYYGETDNETTSLHEETSSSKRLYRRGDDYPEMTMISVETSDDLRTLRAKGITEEFDSPARLLDAFRDKYPQKIIRFSDENGNPLEDTDNHLKKHTDLGGTGITTWQAEKPLYLLIEPWEKYFKNRQTDLFDNNYPDSEVMRAAREDTRRFASLLNISDKVNIITDAGSLSEGEKSVKGWYDRDTDRISVVLPNHSDPDDIRRTVFHEGVAHYGLRRLFGEHFDTFLDNVHDNAAADVRKRIDNISKTEGLSRRDATEEYLARLSEDTDFGRAMQTGWWGKIRELFLQMLGRAGVNLDYKLTDSELRYILWRSYENLRSPEERRTVSSLIKKDREDAVDKLRGLYGKIDDTKENYAEYLDDPSVKGWISGWQKEIDELQKAYGLSRADVFPEEKSAGTDIAAEETPTVAREQALRDTVSGIIKDAGIDVVYDKEACQEALRAMRRTGDTSYQRVYHGSGSDFDRFDMDLIIQDKLRFFHTPDGEAYGFTTGGKIYLDPDIATAETPIHEYTHLWAEALRRRNPEEWNNVVGLMKQCDTVWNDVRRNYPELTDDNDIADEVLATYSGRRGAERLRTLRDGVLSGDSSEDEKKVATSAIDSFRDLLSRIWKDIADFLHIHYTKPEEVADRVLADLVNGVNPSKALDDAYSRAVSEGRTDDALRILEDVAKAKGYDVTDYQGRDSWTAPVAEVEKEDFANLDKLRESLDDYGGESNIYGIINGIQGHDSSYYYNPGKAGFHGKAAEETAEILRCLHERNASPDTKVSIYRAVPNDVLGGNIMQGDWVALSRTYCDDLGKEKYGEGGYHIIQSEAPIKYLWQGDEDMREFGYDDGQRDVEKNVSNNRKLLEITYDDNGKLIPLSKRFDMAASDIRYQFIGENGIRTAAENSVEAVARLRLLDLARTREKMGTDPSAIKLATGWERGADGKWRYETEDAIHIKPHTPEAEKVTKSYALSSVLTGKGAQELFTAYPQLRDYQVAYTEMPGKTRGYLRGKNIVIRDSLSDTDTRRTILHEIQHAVQQIEGFSLGASVTNVRFRINALVDSNRDASEYAKEMLRNAAEFKLSELSLHKCERLLSTGREEDADRAVGYYWDAMDCLDNTEESALKNVYPKDMTPEEIAKSGYHIKEAGNELARLYGKTLENIPDGNRKSLDIVNKLSHDLENMTDAELYALVAGEVEARNVARRMYMTPEERRRTLASETEDVARRDQIFLGYSNGYSADSGNEKESIDIINKHFNKNLEDYEKGNVPFGTRFYLGMPSRELESVGFPHLPITMRASLLSKKAGMSRHPFEATELKGLVKAIQKPIAVFSYSKANMRNLIADVRHKDKNFLVGITLDYKGGGIEVNSVSGLFPKESHEWVKWIQDKKALRIDQKKKVQDIIDSLRTNPAESERIGLNLSLVAKLVKDFENPVIKNENLSEDQINFSKTSVRSDERANTSSVMTNNEKEKARQVQSSPESVGDLKDKETVNDGINYADTVGAASIDKFIEENGHIVGKEPDRNFDILQVDFRDGSTLRRTPQFVTDGAHLRLNYELSGPKVEGKAVESVNYSLFADELGRQGLIDDGRFNNVVSNILKKTETPTLSNKEALRDVDSFVDKYGFDVLGGSGRRAYLDDKRFVERRDTTVVGLQNKGEVTGGKYYFISDDEGRLPQDAAVYVPAMKDKSDNILFNGPDSYGSGIQKVRDAVAKAGVSNRSIVRDIDKFLENHGFEAGDDLGSLRIVDFRDGSSLRRHEQPHSKRAEYMILNSSHEIISFANVPDKSHILDLTPGRAEALSSIRNTLLSRPMRPSNDVALEVIGDFIRDNGRVIEGSDGLKAVDFRDGSSLVGFQKDGEHHFEYRDRNAIPYGVVVSRDMTPKDINLSPSMDKAVNLMYNALDKPLNNDVTLSKEAQEMRSYTNTQGRWHGEEQNELRVYSEYGNILAYFSDHTSKAKPLGVEDYVVGRNPTESLMLSVWKRINHFNSRTFIPEEKLRELGIPVNPMAKPLPLIRDGRDGRQIVNMYNIESTDFLQRSKDYDKETRSYINNLMRSAEHSVLTGDGKYKMWSQLEDLVVKNGNWHLPVESTPKDYNRLKDLGLSARYDRAEKKVSVAPLQMEQPSYGGKRYMDILDSLSESVLDRDNKLIVKNGVGDENTLNVAHLMNAIDFGIDLRDVVDRPDLSGEYVTPLITDADALRSEGPEYVRTVLTEARKADDSIMKRSIGMDDDLSVNSDITIDDDDDDRLDLRTTTPGMGDDDGDGISDDQENYAPSTKEDNRLKRKSDESSHRSFHM